MSSVGDDETIQIFVKGVSGHNSMFLLVHHLTYQPTLTLSQQSP